MKLRHHIRLLNSWPLHVIYELSLPYATEKRGVSLDNPDMYMYSVENGNELSRMDTEQIGMSEGLTEIER